MKITKIVPGTIFSVALLLVVMVGHAAEAARQLEKQEQLFFFPDYAWLTPDGTSWIAPVHGWDYRSEPDAKRRARRTRALAATLRLTKDESATADFERRARRFVVQNQS